MKNEIRKCRLMEVYEYLHNNCNIHTRTEFAERLQITRPALSSAMNGNELYLTDSLFRRICAAFPGVFSLDYLINGEGSLLVEAEHSPEPGHEPPVDQSSLINAIISTKDEAIVSLKRELKSKDETIHALNSQIQTQQELLDTYRHQVADKNKIIASLNARLEQYQKQSDSDPLYPVPFHPMGIAEDTKSIQTK